MRRVLLLQTLVCILSLCSVAAAADRAAAAGARSNEELWDSAPARIEKHRKADATIEVLDASGKRVSGAKVRVEQTRHEFLFGSNIFMWGKVNDADKEAAYRRRFAELLNYATLPFYWPSYEPRRGEPDHRRTEEVARWCREHGIATKGHPLAWNFADPRWLPDDAQESRRLQMARIDDCVSRFAGLIDRWDVVNEAAHFDRPEFLRRAPKMTGMWQKAGKMEFTKECFVHARKANPKATLLINDYRTDPAYERVIEQLADDGGKPMYDVIGIQSHMHGGAWSNQRIWEVCDRFARFKVPLHFTETTIVSGERGREKRGRWASTPEGEASQAQEVARFYTMLFSHPSVAALTWWDFSDYHAWQGAPAGFLRADMSPKPAFQKLLDLIKEQWWTKTDLTSSADGTAKFRGLLGEYRVTVAKPAGKPVTATFTLTKTGPNRWMIRLP
jgi:GH35 family endo-1,4-beta-xylanase